MEAYSSVSEADKIVSLLFSLVNDTSLPAEARAKRRHVRFTSIRDKPYFPIPFKETELGSALKALEGCLAAALADCRDCGPGVSQTHGAITVDLEKTTAFLFQAYLARVGGLGKLDAKVKPLLKDTDLLQAQSNPYRRLAANLYKTALEGHYYHIHGSLEASTTLRMLGLETHRDDLASHHDIVAVIEAAVQSFTPSQLEVLNAKHRQAGAMALSHQDFVKTPHGMTNMRLPPYSVEQLEGQTAACRLTDRGDGRLLAGIKVVELARIIAGPVIGRILAEYGADVLKVTSPRLSDVPFFQVDGNMGKRATELDLKTEQGRRVFEQLVANADVRKLLWA
ncbi:hypothetical protein CDD81_6664 [Ophiocordyceps australis]|uniref:Uncharacterized protein n=1 Tax=Ophiocordyceps australis TaxID=1399860 RepID=A0A2C5Y6B3_9HYPO|nr:hypothetical protein CDD81_6664 [Ophiocordyceps australis]